MNYKYQQDYDLLITPCPPIDYKAKNIDAVYRWVFDDIQDSRNFLPQYHRKPQRFLHKEDIDKCKGMALSLFSNSDGALKRYAELKDLMGSNISKTLGTQIAEGSLSEEDGVNGEMERLGHFSHHSSSSVSYVEKFTIIQKL